MYKVGEVVMHRQEGACQIKDIIMMEVGGSEKEYFRLVPVMNVSAQVYISTNAEKQNNIRPIIRMEELELIRTEVAENPLEWVENPKQRLGVFSKKIATFDFKELFLVYNCLKEHERDKRLNVREKEWSDSIEKLIFSEISLLKKVPYEQVAREYS